MKKYLKRVEIFILTWEDNVHDGNIKINHHPYINLEINMRIYQSENTHYKKNL